MTYVFLNGFLATLLQDNSNHAKFLNW